MCKPEKCVIWTWIGATLLAFVPLALISLWLYHRPIIPRQWTLFFSFIWSSVLLIVLCLYLPLRQRHLHYAIDQEQVMVTSGVLFRKEHSIPLGCVRHVTLLQGPIERYTNTAFLLVRSTGGLLLLEGIPVTQAENWRNLLLAS